MLLSDRDIRKAVAAGEVLIDPFDPAMIQPSSVDVRLDRYFRVFENHRYPHIDPALEQPELTRMVEPAGSEPFILHPGEFVLASTFERVHSGFRVRSTVGGEVVVGSGSGSSPTRRRGS